MAHKCFQCNEKFKTSGELVIHMREGHSSFVKDAQEKISRVKHKVNPDRNTYGAACPFCKADYRTKKKLIAHLECEHKDNDSDESEPQMKIIRLSTKTTTPEDKDELKPRSQSSSSTGTSLIEELLNSIDSDVEEKPCNKEKPCELPITSGKTAMEKRYRCFWCDSSFRKRGKLMDHIDTFHKDKKQQTEDEAEKLQEAILNEEKPVKEVPISATITRPEVKSSNSTLLATPTPAPRCTNNKTAYKLAHPYYSSPRPLKKDKCTFRLIGSLTEVSRFAEKRQIYRERNAIKFYKGHNPLTGTKPPLIIDLVSDRESSDNDCSEFSAPSSPLAPSSPISAISPPPPTQKTASSKSTAESLVSVYSFLQLAAGVNTVTQQASIPASDTSVSTAYSNPAISFVPPVSPDVYDLSQRTRHDPRDQHYLNYMHSFSSMQSFDLNTPLDLSTTKLYN